MSNRTDKALVLLSGGLDSVVATFLARLEFTVDLALTFDYGQRAAAHEINISRAVCESLRIEHQVISLPWMAKTTTTALVNSGSPLPRVSPETLGAHDLDNASAVWVPNRNGAFIAIAAAFAESRGCSTIFAGFNSEEAETYPDNSDRFVSAMNESLKLSTANGVSVNCPLMKMRKDEIAERFVSLDIDPELFWCCYDGGKKLCGKCESCARAMRAFKRIGAWKIIAGRFESGGQKL